MRAKLDSHVIGPLLLAALIGCTEGRTAQVPDTLPPFRAAQIETLLETRLPCLGCHTIDGEGGRIGPDLSEVGARLTHEQIDTMVRMPDSRMPNTVMPAVIMREDWRALVIRYLAERGGRSSPALVADGSPLVGVPPTRGDASGREADRAYVLPPGPDAEGADASPRPDGATLYSKYCATCHGTTGGGDGANAQLLPAPPTVHSDPEYMRERPDDSLYDAIYAGGYIMSRSHTMPPFGATLSRPQIRALVHHMRELCGCEGPAWSRDGVIGGG
jgi:mono/diheme cytochrome c family protein